MQAGESRTQKRRNNYSPAAAVIGILLVAVVVLAVGFVYSRLGDKSGADISSADSYPFIVDFIDVGQGDCELIRCGEVSVLIDGGEADASSKVISFLRKKGVSVIDCYILTHPHTDHIGAAASVMKNFEIKNVLCTEFSASNAPTTSTYQNTLSAIDASGAEVSFVKAGDKFNFGNLKINILSPDVESEDYNDMSVVCTVGYKKVTAFFGGDASMNIERQLLDRKAAVKADIMKLSHHGSSSANGREFIEAVSPALCVIPVGRDNAYGHPHAETIDTLTAIGVPYYRTDLNGTVTVFSDGDKIFTETEK